MRHCGGHSPGHCLIDLESDGQRAVMIGHLAISPIHAAAGNGGGLHRDGAAAWEILTRELEEAASNNVMVVGPLWPNPGAVRVVSTDPIVVEPAASTFAA